MRLAPASVLLAALALSSPARAANPYLAGALGEVFPGAGYLANGDTKSGLMSASLIVPIGARYYVTTPTFAEKSVKENLALAARNLHGYTVYDSFQSAMTSEHRGREVLKTTHHGFSDLFFSPFHGSTYQNGKIWLPLGLAALAVTSKLVNYGVSPDLTADRLLVSVPLILIQSMLIGVGEEAEFRGYQYAAFSQLTGSTFVGNLMQSLSFGVCHTRWGVCASPYGTGHLLRATNTIDLDREYQAAASPSDGQDVPDLRYMLTTAVYGFWWGLMAQDPNGLKSAVASHALFDALLITSDLITTNNTGRLYLSVSFPSPL